MNITEQARKDFETFLTDSDNGFAENITIKAKDMTTLNLSAYCTGHRNGFDTEGNPINVQQVSITLSERVLSSNSYPYLNADNQCDLDGHNVIIPSAVGSPVEYRIEQWYHDQEIGAIVCMLGWYKNEI